jgi:imidazolonepropionase-like amidohydrolase
VQAGLSPVEAIHAATGRASQLIELDNQVGTLRPGLQADLLLVDGNAAQDVRHLASVRAVYQSGHLVNQA